MPNSSPAAVGTGLQIRPYGREWRVRTPVLPDLDGISTEHPSDTDRKKKPAAFPAAGVHGGLNAPRSGPDHAAQE
jgi:hypothetical protein